MQIAKTRQLRIGGLKHSASRGMYALEVERAVWNLGLGSGRPAELTGRVGFSAARIKNVSSNFCQTTK